jgi:Domain of unknown function (DUF6265)
VSAQEKNMHIAPILALALLAFSGNGAVAAEGDLEKLAWLSGCWKSQSAEAGSGEQWTPIAGGTMLGTSRTVKQGKTVEFEFMQLRYLADRTLAFVAQPSGQSATVFPLLRITDAEAVFENPQHDFPQRVVYARDGETRLLAKVEGMRRGALRILEFPMVRVSCDAQLSATGR